MTARNYSALFDYHLRGINFYLGAGFLLASTLSLLTWEIVGHVIEGTVVLGAEAKYYTVQFVLATLETAIFLLLSYSIRQDWLLPWLFGIGIVIEGIVRRAIMYTMFNFRQGLFEPSALLLNFVYGFLFMLALVFIVRVWGPRLRGLMLGLTLALLIDTIFVQFVFIFTKPDYSFNTTGVISSILDGLLFGALIYAGYAFSQRKSGSHGIGILFNIDELGGLYGHAAYKIFFKTINTSELAGCSLSDGDTKATLEGNANVYCIAVGRLDARTLPIVETAFVQSNAKGLLPLTSRFLYETLVEREPLVLAAYINRKGELVDCETGWVMEAWQESQK